MREPLAPGQDVRKDWVRINAIDADTVSVVRRITELEALTRDLETRIRRNRHFDLYPFRVYSCPSALRPSPDYANDWRKFRVRAGAILVDEQSAGIDVTGTDGANDDPDSGAMPSAGDFTVPVNVAAYWVWVEVYYTTEWVANIRHGQNPAGAAAAGENNPNPWALWPDMDGHRILIASIDTDTYASTKRAVVRQLIRTDIMMGSRFTVCQDGAEKMYTIPGLAEEGLE